MANIWEDDEEDVSAAGVKEAIVHNWERDILKLSVYPEWASLRKFLLYREKQYHNKLYTQNASNQELFVGKTIGKAGAFREVIDLPQQLQEKINGRKS
jgi:hypothetical protein